MIRNEIICLPYIYIYVYIYICIYKYVYIYIFVCVSMARCRSVSALQEPLNFAETDPKLSRELEAQESLYHLKQDMRTSLEGSSGLRGSQGRVMMVWGFRKWSVEYEWLETFKPSQVEIHVSMISPWPTFPHFKLDTPTNCEFFLQVVVRFPWLLVASRLYLIKHPHSCY